MRARPDLVHPSLRVPRGGLRPLPDPLERSQAQAEEGLARSLYLSCRPGEAHRALARAVGRLRWLKDVWKALDDARALLLMLDAAFEQYVLPRAHYDRALRMYACAAAEGIGYEEVIAVMRAVALGGRNLEYEWFDVRFRSSTWTAMPPVPGSRPSETVRCEVSHALTDPDALRAATVVTERLVEGAAVCWLDAGGAETVAIRDGFVVDGWAPHEQADRRLSALLRQHLGNPFEDVQPPVPGTH